MMHCFECEKRIDVTGGMFDMPVYLYSKRAYHHEKVRVIECPHCQALLGIQDFVTIDLTQEIKIDKRVQTPLRSKHQRRVEP